MKPAVDSIVLSIRILRDPEKNGGPIFMEPLFAAVHSLPSSVRVSFEIFYADGILSFCVAVPQRYRFLIENQIYAQYPGAEVCVVDSPDFSGFSFVCGTELHFIAPSLYPIKRYQQFEDQLARLAVDPLAGVTEALSTAVDGKHTACIQIVIRPLDERSRVLHRRCIHALQSQKNFFLQFRFFQNFFARLYCMRSLWWRIFCAPLYFTFWMISSASATLPVQKEEEVTTVHARETALGAASDKIAKLAFVTTIRIIAGGSSSAAVRQKIYDSAAPFQQFTVPHINGFRMGRFLSGPRFVSAFVHRSFGRTCTLNLEELATVYHFPTAMVATPGVQWVPARSLPPPAILPKPDVILGASVFRGRSIPFGLTQDDRRRHTYIIGKTGMGKSTLLESMILSDIRAGYGCGVIDPHGDLVDKILASIPSHRTNDVILFDPADRDFPVAFNVMDADDPSSYTLIASGLVGVFKKLYGESWGPRLEHILRNTILALLSYKQMTLLGIVRMLQDAHFRVQVVDHLTDPVVRSFWLHEFAGLDQRSRVEAVAPILNKVGQFLSSPIIRHIVGQPKSTIHLRFAMDRQKIVLVNLAKGKIGEDQSSLLGALLITQFQLEAMARANVPLEQRTDFFLYVDEFQNFATDSFATILSEARKYRLSLVLAHQYVNQMSETLRDAVFGNIGTVLAFQVGADDAEALAMQFGNAVLPEDLGALPKYHFYTRLLVDGRPTPVFSAQTLPPVSFSDFVRGECVRRFVRERYGRPVAAVADKIRRWSAG